MDKENISMRSCANFAQRGNTTNPYLKKYNITYEDVKEAYATSKKVVPEIPSLNFNCK